MIASRRKDTRRSSRVRNKQLDNSKKVSNVDRTIGTSRAKRDAALRKRRGLAKTGKASQMDIEKEVQKEHKKTVMKKAKDAKGKKGLGRNSEVKQERRKLARAAAKAKKEELAQKNMQKKKSTTKNLQIAETAPLGRPPSKKAVKAAVSAMETKGFKIPEGYQMVVSFAPTQGGQGSGKPAPKKNPPKGKGGRK